MIHFSNFPSSVYEFTVGKGIWDVFATREWEMFGVDFNRLCCCVKDWNTKEGIQTEVKGVGSDGRKRYGIKLPDLDWTLANVSVSRFPDFPVRNFKNEKHVPLYLDFAASLVVEQQGDRLLDLIRSSENKNFGSAKLVAFDKVTKTYTIIVYGAPVPTAQDI